MCYIECGVRVTDPNDSIIQIKWGYILVDPFGLDMNGKHASAMQSFRKLETWFRYP